MTLIDKLKNNPFIYVIIICSIVIPSSVGVTTWFYENQMRSKEAKYQADISNLTNKYEAKILKLELIKSDEKLLKSLNDSNNKINELKVEIEKKNVTISKLEGNIKENILINSQQKSVLDKTEDELLKVKKNLESKNKEIEKLNNDVNFYITNREENKKLINRLNDENLEKKKSIENLKEKISIQDNKIKDLNNDLSFSQDNREANVKLINRLNDENLDKKHQIEDLNRKIVEKELIFSKWKGSWETHYSNSFKHDIVFSDTDNELIGKYHFNDKTKGKVNGEIYITKFTDNTIHGIWLQNESGNIVAGKLKFILESENQFKGTYWKKEEKYSRSYSWNGKR